MKRKQNFFVACDGYIKMQIVLRDGRILESKIDTEDFDKVYQHPYCWGAHYEKRMNKYYVTSPIFNEARARKTIFLHRVVTNCPDGFVIDHLNHDTLDNRKSNLRIVKQSENLLNKNGNYRNSKSGVRGVFYHKCSKKWYAQVQIGGKKVFLKLFDDFEGACKAVVAARKNLFGNILYHNFEGGNTNV